MRRYNRCLFFCYNDFWVYLVSGLIILIICSIFFVGCFVKFSFCDRYNGLVSREEDNYYVSILVDNSWFDLQIHNLVVDKKELDYSIISISSDYTITDSGLKKEVVLKFDISEDKKINNNVLNLYFVRKMTFFEKIKEMVI